MDITGLPGIMDQQMDITAGCWHLENRSGDPFAFVGGVCDFLVITLQGHATLISTGNPGNRRFLAIIGIDPNFKS